VDVWGTPAGAQVNIHGYGWLSFDSVSSNGRRDTLRGEGDRDFFLGGLVDLNDANDDVVFVET
jgi:hypothetical protein